MLWTCTSNIYNLYIHGDWGNLLWKKTIYEFTNGPVSRYLYGWWISNSSREIKNMQEECNYTWYKYNDYSNYDINYFSAPVTKFIFYNRLFSLLLSLCVLGITYFFLTDIFGSMAATAGVFLLGLNPLFRTYAVRSMAEMPFLLFMTMSLYALWKLINTRKANVKLLIIYGVLCGLTVMTKPYGIIVLLPWFIYLLLFRNLKFKKKIAYSSIILFFSFMTIIIVYPPFYKDPFSIHQWLTTWFDIQKAAQLRHPEIVLNTPIDKLDYILRSLIFPGKKSIFSSLPWLNIILIFSSITVMGVKILNRKGLSLKDKYLCSVILGFIIGGLFYLYREWERYLLPFVYILILLYTYLFEIIFKILNSFIKDRYKLFRKSLPSLL